MTNKILSLFLGIAFPYLLCGQGETANWYFGNGGGIRFNNDGSVNAVADGRLNTFEGCATISDAFGDLLFYTDGITVYDRNHNVMQNGTGLYGDPSSTQSAIIVPRPQDPNIYYIFTVDTSSFENDPDRGLNYSTVDISLNAGNGSVIQKNVRLLDDCSEKITAVIGVGLQVGQVVKNFDLVAKQLQLQGELVGQRGIVLHQVDRGIFGDPGVFLVW